MDKYQIVPRFFKGPLGNIEETKLVRSSTLFESFSDIGCNGYSCSAKLGRQSVDF